MYFMFDAIMAVVYSIIAAIICLAFVPQDIRNRILDLKNSVWYIISSKVQDDTFCIIGFKRNKRIVNKYFDEKIKDLHIKIFDVRKFKIKRNLKKMYPHNYKGKYHYVLKEIYNQKKQFLNSVKYLLLDKSGYNAEVYLKRYDYCELLDSMLQYTVSQNENFNIGIKFIYHKTKKNNLPMDIEFTIKVDDFFIKKYSELVERLYFDYTEALLNLEHHKKQEEFQGWTEDAILRFLEKSKRNNMDVYDLEIDDYIKYVAPKFYNKISIIAEGEWVYSKLDLYYYRIANFKFDLEKLSELCKGMK